MSHPTVLYTIQSVINVQVMGHGKGWDCLCKNRNPGHLYSCTIRYYVYIDAHLDYEGSWADIHRKYPSFLTSHKCEVLVDRMLKRRTLSSHSHKKCYNEVALYTMYTHWVLHFPLSFGLPLPAALRSDRMNISVGRSTKMHKTAPLCLRSSELIPL